MILQRWILHLILVLSILSLPGCLSMSRREQTALEVFENANTLREEGQLEEAVTAYRKVLKLRPGTTGASFNLALTLAEMDNFSESIKILERLEKQDPLNIRILQAKGWVFRKQGKYEDAISNYNAVLDIFDNDKTSIRSLAEIEEQLGLLDKTIARIEKLLIIDDSVENHKILARLYEQNNSLQAVLQEYRWIESHAKLEPDTQLIAGKIAEKLKLYDDAMEYYSNVSKANTEHSMEAWFLLAQLQLITFQDYASGLTSLEQALDAGFQDDKAIYNLLLELPPDIHPSIAFLLAKQETDMNETHDSPTENPSENSETQDETQPLPSEEPAAAPEDQVNI